MNLQLGNSHIYEIIEDVKTLKSEIGILYINDFNQKVINKLLKENNLILISFYC